jgi:hypothetical protein
VNEYATRTRRGPGPVLTARGSAEAEVDVLELRCHAVRVLLGAVKGRMDAGEGDPVALENWLVVARRVPLSTKDGAEQDQDHCSGIQGIAQWDPNRYSDGRRPSSSRTLHPLHQGRSPCPRPVCTRSTRDRRCVIT